MKRSALIIMFMSLTIQQAQSANAYATAVIRVVDELNTPVHSANVEVSFEQDNVGGKEVVHRGTTDTNGIFAASENTSGYIYFRVSKQKYYDSTGKLKWHQQSLITGRFPHSGTTNLVVLRPILNQVPMYAQKIHLRLPASSKPFGFDFIKADWVQPYGKGVNPDIQIQINGSYQDINNYSGTLNLVYLGTSNGLQQIKQPPVMPSSFKWPRQAPIQGYESTQTLQIGRINGDTALGDPKGDQNSYFFRIRGSLADSSSDTALYGKIVDGFHFGGLKSTNPGVWFTYYLNPTPNDQNLEFDPSRNLFTNLGPMEAVYEP